MGRTKIIPDTDIFAIVRSLLVQGGDKAVAFSSVSRVTQLAPATLVQRFGSRDGMLRAALLAGWDALDAAAERAISAAVAGPKGAGQILKALPAAAGDLGLLAAGLRDAAIRARAQGWRQRVEAGLALHLGGAVKGADPAAMLFAAWQGQLLWQTDGFRVKDAARRLSA
jgi:hypothetical protein